MPEVNQDGTASIEACGSQPSNNIFASPTRRSVLALVLATGGGAAVLSAAVAEDDQPGSDERPQQADLLVFSEGDRAGKVIQPHDLNLGGPPVLAWPKDPQSGVVRDGSRLNEVLIVKLDPAELDDDTRARSADGIVAYSAICSHAGCPVTAWVKGAAGDKEVFKCVCHNSEYDPRQGAQVVFGPAPRRLAPLPLQSTGDSLTVAATFVGKVGQQAG
jgi:rieske iron-sulfur protein